MPPLSLLFLSLLLPFTTLSQTTFTSLTASNSPWSPSGNRLLLSNNTLFSAGFLPLSKNPSLYTFSVWYHNISSIHTPLWSANQNSPVNGSATLSVSSSGSLRLLANPSGPNLWPGTSTNGTKLVLGNNGKLVFGGWSSFEHPTDTILPNQNMNQTAITSKNKKYKFVNSTFLVFNETESYWTSVKAMQILQDDGKVLEADGASFISSDFGENRTRRLTIDDDGNLRIYTFEPKTNKWTVVWRAIGEICKVNGICGPNSICMSSDDEFAMPICVCPPGFRKNSGGDCERKIAILENRNTKFLKLDYVNFSGGSNQTIRDAQNISLCEGWCLTDPKCLGYGFKYDGLGYCVLQIDRLLNGYWSPGTETAMFLRVDNSETDKSNFTGMTNLMETTCPIRISLPLPPKQSNSTTRNIIIVCTLFAAELISGFLFFWAFLKKYIKYRDMARTLGLEFLPAGGPKRFTHAELKSATNNFSSIIGRGGFGDVYKGELSDHRIVAVKCLKNVAGGDAEFWAEVTIIARMHHLNLVRLWGFCAEKGQRILVYEYVPNGSLDKFLFSSVQAKSTTSEGETDESPQLEYNKPVLDWSIRYRIALGVARAIAYLHEECLEWVLHCDIKPENILLGDDFCPKISDFGLAKLRKKEDMVSMSRIRGTRGYMAPEWVKSETITSKADVYSFGMVLLEIVTGVRNFEIQGSKMDSDDWYFPRWAYEKAFKEMKVEDILDRRIKHSYDSRAHFEIVDRMVKTAMWCLQDRAELRPSMGKVAKMLEGTVEITEPKKPTIFYLGED